MRFNYFNLTPKIFCGGNHNNNVVPMSSAMSWWGIGVGAMAGVVAAPMALSVAGFTASGVAAGSLAAWAQSTFYGGATGGIFSLCQSAGAAGLGLAGNAAAGGVGAGLGFGAAKAVQNATDNTEEENGNQKDNVSS